MSTLAQRLAFRWLARVEAVPVAACVHFAGFRYGRGELNPYENYAAALVRGEPVAAARAWFVEFLQHYRPRHLGEALGVELGRDYPLWHYPWSRRPPEAGAGRAGWRESPHEVPDIITHYSARGILRPRIAEEFAWLERCLGSIREHGYRPAEFSGDITVRRLAAADGAAAYVVHDGNHRLAALGALGVRDVPVRWVPLMEVREADLPRWPGVADGTFPADDARRVFRAYFSPRTAARTTAEAAAVVDA